ncbi:MAG: NADH-quinone oxidoreductase subunit A [Chloroflexi bacterium]|nr:NADH-quinone oxidoreductase subunit A [Chloroflexota bacterium]
MLADYGYIGLFLVAALLFAVSMLLIPIALKFIKIVPQKPSPTKNSIFECGMETIGKTWVQFNFRYYFYALVFIILDVLVVFLYPWAVNLRELGYSGLVVALILIAIVVVGYLYAWRKKALEWK